MKSVLIYKRAQCHRRWFVPVLKHFEKCGYEASLRIGKPPSCLSFTRIIIWNGNHHVEMQLARKCQQAGVCVNFLEVGYFPQAKYAMLSRHGSVGGHLFAGESIPALPSDGESRLQNALERFAGRLEYLPTQTSGFLQLPYDYAVTSHSRFRSMQEYIDEVEAKYSDAVFKVHPRQRRVFCKSRRPFYRGALIWPHIMRAKRCVGINSTCLYEAALAGVPVTALGESPLKQYPHLHREIVHEILLRQIPVDGSDIGEQVLRSVGEI